MDNPYDSVTPEQKLHILSAEIRAPLQLILDLTESTRMIIEAKSPEFEEVLDQLNSTIQKAAGNIKNLIDEIVRSEGFYRPSDSLSSTDILLHLRQTLLDAREQDQAEKLRNIGIVCDILLDATYKKGDGLTGRILENIECSVSDSLMGVPWKSTIPSEEEIISVSTRK